MTIALAGTPVLSNSGSTLVSTATVTLPSTAVGNIIVLAVSANTSGANVDPAQTVSGFTAVPGGTSTKAGTPQHRLSLFYRFVQTGDPTTVTATLAATGNMVFAAVPYSGVDPTTPFVSGEVRAASQPASTTTWNTGTITTAAARWIISVFANRTNGTWTAGSFTDTLRLSGNTASAANIAYEDTNAEIAAGTITARTATFSSATSVGNTAIVALNPAPPASGPVPTYFSAASPINKPVNSNPVLDANSTAIATLLGGNGGTTRPAASIVAYGVPIYKATASTPRFTCTTSAGAAGTFKVMNAPAYGDPFAGLTIPIDPSWVGSPGYTVDGYADKAAVIIDTNGRAFSLFQFVNGTTPQCDYGGWQWTDSNQTVISDALGDATGAGISRLAGVVRKEELAAGSINHALVVSSRYIRPTTVVYPAKKSDGNYKQGSGVGATTSNSIPEAQRFYLDPSIDIDAIVGITAFEKMIAKAAQTYGIYPIDNTGSSKAFQIIMEMPAAGTYTANGSYNYTITDPVYTALGVTSETPDLSHIPWAGNLKVIEAGNWDSQTQSTLSRWLAKAPYYIAHRGGSTDYVEMTRDAYTKSIGYGATAINIDAVKCSTGEFVASHDTTTGRVFGTNYTIGSTPWSTLSTLTTTTGGYPIEKVSDLLDAFPNVVVFIENKGNSTDQAALLDILDTRGGKDRIVIKQYYTASAVSTAAKARGYTTWGYYYAADLTSLASTHTRWDILGLDYLDTATADWTLIKSYGKKVLGHVIPSIAGATQAFNLGADGIMTGKIIGVVPQLSKSSVVISGAKKSVLNRFVVVGGVRKPVANRYVIIGGVKKPL